MGQLTLILPECPALGAPFLVATSRNGPYFIGQRVYGLLKGEIEPGENACFLIDGIDALPKLDEGKFYEAEQDIDAFLSTITGDEPFILCDARRLAEEDYNRFYQALEEKRLLVPVLLLTNQAPDDFSIVALEEVGEEKDPQGAAFGAFADDYLGHAPLQPGTTLPGSVLPDMRTTRSEREQESKAQAAAAAMKKEEGRFKLNVLYLVFVFLFGFLAAFSMAAIVFTEKRSLPIEIIFLIMDVAFVAFGLLSTIFLGEIRAFPDTRLRPYLIIIITAASAFYILVGSSVAALANQKNLNSWCLWIGCTLIVLYPVYVALSFWIQTKFFLDKVKDE